MNDDEHEVDELVLHGDDEDCEVCGDELGAGESNVCGDCLRAFFGRPGRAGVGRRRRLKLETKGSE